MFIYDAFPGGVGLSPRLFAMHDRLMAAAVDLISGCDCATGCPACVGAMVERGIDAGATACMLAAGQRWIADTEPSPAGVHGELAGAAARQA